MRVAWATFFLVVAKLVTAVVPFFFKYATDALDGKVVDVPWLPLALLASIASSG